MDPLTKKLAKDLERAHEHLQQIDEMQNDFVSLTTHQIRAPLTAIKGYISLIQDGDYGPVSDQMRTAIDVVARSTQNLVQIIDDFLNISRIEQNRMKYEFAPVDVTHVVRIAITKMIPAIEKAGINLTTYVQPHIVTMVNADHDRLVNVVEKVIENSLKFTPKGSIAISIERGMHKPHSGDSAEHTDAGKEVIWIAIKDTGIGMQQETIPKLFSKFTRLKDANKVNILGIGVSLYIAKKMIEAHHGHIWAESDGSGKGSQFYIELQAI